MIIDALSKMVASNTHCVLRHEQLLLDRWPVQALAATLNLSLADTPRDELPPLWQWLYFLRATPRAEMNVDGHPLEPDLLDSTDQWRRMFGAARMQFERPLILGQLATMTESRIATRDTESMSGAMRIVTLEYQYFQHGQLCICEQRDIVYIKANGQHTQRKPKLSAIGSPFISREITPDPVLLMRFSALTFNAHRIHYDQEYAQQQENYPERVVQGPLVAVLLAALLHSHSAGYLKRFEFRARRPLFVNSLIRLTAESRLSAIMLEALDAAGDVAMEATACY